MKEKNIKLFKQFLQFRGLEKIFAGLYRTHRFQANPEDLEQYLTECDAFFVISEAFDFEHIKVTGPYDSQFWKDLNKMWIKYMRKQAGLGYYRDEIVIPRIPVKDANGNVIKPKEEADVDEEIINEEAEAPKDFVSHDWSGLNLVPINPTGKRMMEAPKPLEIRVCTHSGNVVLLSNHIAYQIVRDGLMMMNMQVDKNTNNMVFVFSKKGDFNVRKYSSELYSIQHKNVITYLSRYLNIQFDPQKVYYIKIKEKIWNKDHTMCAVVVTTEYTEKDR